MVTGSTFREAVGALSGDKLVGVPKGYPANHPAMEYLRFKQFLAVRACEPTLAITDGFYPELLRTFRAVAPLVRFLNTPLFAERGDSLSDVPRPVWRGRGPGR
jgi:hypothetical protein